jgi:Tol biopolymer transport system component
MDAETWHLRTVDTRSLQTRPLVTRPGSSLSPTWISPDRVAFSYSPPGSNHDTELVLRLVDREGADLGELLLPGLKGNSNAQYSSAAGRLVFNSIRDGNWEIYTAELGGRDERRLTTNAREGSAGIDGQPEWAPVGDRIAIISGRVGSFDIVILTPDGAEERNLTAEWLRGEDSQALP